jgi:predicted glycoside hydrolase/deacetylase ChbG (UPF0249 family)
VKLLINADDLGYTPVINQAIFDLHSRGRLTSTSLLVNLPFSQDAIDGLHAHPDLRVGVHLNLTKGRPLLSPERVPSLVNTTGEFWGTMKFFTRATTGRVVSAEIETELQAQIEQVLDVGIQPTHLDSHSHWHILPHLRNPVIKLAKSNRISGIRQSAPRRTLIPSRLLLTMVTRKALPQSKFRIPNYLLSLHQWMGADGHPSPLFFSERLRRLVANPEVTLELVTHPGKQDDPDFPPDTLLTHQRQWEVEFLLSSYFDEWLEMMDAEIVNYKAL